MLTRVTRTQDAAERAGADGAGGAARRRGRPSDTQLMDHAARCVAAHRLHGPSKH